MIALLLSHKASGIFPDAGEKHIASTAVVNVDVVFPPVISKLGYVSPAIDSISNNVFKDD